MAEVKAYCMKCKAKRVVKNPKAITHSNGRKAIKGTCSVCGTTVYRMGTMAGLKGPAPDVEGEEEEEETPPPASKKKGKKKSIIQTG